MSNFDFKKEYKDIYLPTTAVHSIQITKMNYIMIEGKGNPNIENGTYQEAIQLLYALSYTIKMSVRNGKVIQGYFPYVVPPLEGLWWNMNYDASLLQKDNLCWYAMIRQPDFVDEELFIWACEQVTKKKGYDTTKAFLYAFEEGLCVQLMHIGTYDEESQSFQKMTNFIKENDFLEENRNLPNQLTQGVHHEIYLSDPRKTKVENLKTVLRKQVTHIKE